MILVRVAAARSLRVAAAVLPKRGSLRFWRPTAFCCARSIIYTASLAGLALHPNLLRLNKRVSPDHGFLAQHVDYYMREDKLSAHCEIPGHGWDASNEEVRE